MLRSGWAALAFAVLASSGALAISIPIPPGGEDAASSMTPPVVHIQTVQPKQWEVRERFNQAYADNPVPTSKMGPDDAARFWHREPDDEVLIWTEGEAHTHVATRPEHIGPSSQPGTVLITHGRTLTTSEIETIEKIGRITWTSSIFPLASIDVTTDEDIHRLAALPTVYMIEFEPQLMVLDPHPDLDPRP